MIRLEPVPKEGCGGKNIQREKRAYAERHPDRIRIAGLTWRHNNKGKSAAISAKRRSSKLQATPIWADHHQIKKIYDTCIDITVSTGILHEVDHYYPLQGKTVCGLHVAENLRIITATENRSKRNAHPE